MSGVEVELLLHIFLHSVLYGDYWRNLLRATGPISLHHIKVLRDIESDRTYISTPYQGIINQRFNNEHK
jgi:hypothetical protein